MTSSPISPTIPVVQALAPQHFETALEFLGRDPVQAIFMISWLDNYGVRPPGNSNLFRFHGVFEAGRLAGISLVISGRLALLEVESERGARALGAYMSQTGVELGHIVSSSAAVGPFWEIYRTHSPHKPTARLNRTQRVYSLERQDWVEWHGPSATSTGLRLARGVDLDAVFLASAAMHAEETLDDPLDRDPDHFRRHVLHRIDTERTYVWFDEHRRLIFKADISAQSRFGAQISGVFTPPQMRGRGVATAAMNALVEALLSRGFPRVTLYVNEENAAAIRVYEKAGFTYHGPYQTVFVMDDD